jgi:hypothetical protein
VFASQRNAGALGQKHSRTPAANLVLPTHLMAARHVVPHAHHSLHALLYTNTTTPSCLAYSDAAMYTTVPTHHENKAYHARPLATIYTVKCDWHRTKQQAKTSKATSKCCHCCRHGNKAEPANTGNSTVSDSQHFAKSTLLSCDPDSLCSPWLDVRETHTPTQAHMALPSDKHTVLQTHTYPHKHTLGLGITQTARNTASSQPGLTLLSDLCHTCCDRYQHCRLRLHSCLSPPHPLNHNLPYHPSQPCHPAGKDNIPLPTASCNCP